MSSSTLIATMTLALPMALVLYASPASIDMETRMYFALVFAAIWLIIMLAVNLANDPGRDSTYISERQERETNTAVYIVVQRSEPSEPSQVYHYHDHQHSHTHRHIVEHVALPAQPDYQDWPTQPAQLETRERRPQTVTVSRPERRMLEDKSTTRPYAARVPVAYITPGEDY